MGVKTTEWIHRAKIFLYSLIDIEYEEKIMLIEEIEEEVALPDDYLERFTRYPLENKEHLKGREEEFENLQRAYENWKISNNPLLIIGETGEGTSSLMYASSSLYPHVKIIENSAAIHSEKRLLYLLKKAFRLEEEYKSINEIRDYILSSDENHVVIFENIERMFIRKISGFSLIEEFLLFLHKTKSKVYWIVTVNKYSNYYLSSVKLFAANFTSIIQLKALPDVVLKEEIMKRNDGFSQVYLKPSRITKKFNKKLKTVDKEQRQKLLQEEFEKRLFLYSKGNISRAILFARLSSYKVKENVIYLKPYEQKPIAKLTLNELFLIEAIFQHSRLTINEFNNVLRNSKRESRLAIEQLLEKKLINAYKEKSGRVEYGINLVYSVSLKVLLRERLNRNFKI